jgi:pimeloyl-ACP methyl ester carboxylesterase
LPSEVQGGTLPDELIAYYVGLLSNPDSLRGSLGFYRAFDSTLAQNAERMSTPMAIPVLAIGGEAGYGEHVGEAMSPHASDLQSVVIAGAGHWIAEQAPEDLLAALTSFLAPYSEGSAAETPTGAATIG